MPQAEGLTGAIVDRMIRRSVRKTFRGVYWIPPEPPPEPCILVPNHNGWHDGYVMYHAAMALNVRIVDWIQEYDAFPLFGRVGGMPFPAGDPARRAATIRQTIRLMREERRNLLMFAEGVLHPPEPLLPFGRALELVAAKVEDATVIPVAIRYEMSMHERPECFILFGDAMAKGPDLAERTRLSVAHLLDDLLRRMRTERDSFRVLAKGTLDVNERMDMRAIPGRRKK